MFQVSVDEEFAAGHALRGYQGKCENPHGHNYKVRVTLEGESLNKIGLLYDFVNLKQAIHSAIGKLDHQYMNDVAPFDVLNPSAENLAKYFYEQVSRLLAEYAGKSGNGTPETAFCRVNQVKVWETSTTTATYFADGPAGSG